MEPKTIILLVGILCVFLGIFGGGFQIKEITVPKINGLSRAMGAIFGIVLIALSSISIPGINLFDEEGATPTVVEEVPKTNPELSSGTPANPVARNLDDELDELEVAWQNASVSNSLLFDKYSAIRQDDIYDDLSIVHQSNIENRLKTLQQTLDAYQELEETIQNELVTIQEKLNMLDVVLDPKVSGLRLTNEDETKFQSIFSELDGIYQSSPTIESSD